MKLDIHNPGSVAFMFKSKSKTLNRQQNGNMSKWLSPLLPPPPYTHPVDSQVLRPDCSQSCLFWTCVCSMQDVMASFAHHHPSVLQDLHGAKAYFSQGIWWCYFSQLFQFRNHHLPSPGPLVFFPVCGHGDTHGVMWRSQVVSASIIPSSHTQYLLLLCTQAS